MGRENGTHGILVAVEARIVKPSIRAADAQCQRWVIGVRCKIIDEIQVVGSEVHTAEWRVVWDRKSSRSTAC